MKLVVATVTSTLILWWRASLLESPTVVPASTVPWRWIAPVRGRTSSRSVVLPLWNGPTSAIHLGPLGPPFAPTLAPFGPLSLSPMIASLDFRVRPVVGPLMPSFQGKGGIGKCPF